MTGMLGVCASITELATVLKKVRMPHSETCHFDFTVCVGHMIWREYRDPLIRAHLGERFVSNVAKMCPKRWIRMHTLNHKPERRIAGRILVVDDERPVREMLVRWLTTTGYECMHAASVAEAITFLGHETLDLVITDNRMPGESGFDLLAWIHAYKVDVATLMLTGCEDPQLATQAITSGACNYLLKPVVKKELLFQVGRVFAMRQTALSARSHTTALEEQVSDQMRMVQLAHEEVIHRLVVASMVRDDETGAHVKRIGQFSAAIAEAIGWSREAIEHMRMAAPMHDIGKIGIPDAILLKPGKLSVDEFEVMKTHTLIGASILKNSYSPMMQLAEQIARSHHERWDGAGYPDKLVGEAIPESARIVAIVDVYDALTHDRVYRPALPEAKALEILHQGRASHFDPALFDTFLDTLPTIRELSRADAKFVPAENVCGASGSLHPYLRGFGGIQAQ